MMNPKLITWARERANLGLDDLVGKPGLAKLREWESGEIEPTIKQLSNFAERVNVPDGYLYMYTPPDESLKSFRMEDFRTPGSHEAGKLSPNMIDVICDCRIRQDWYREYAIAEKLAPVSFVGSVKLRRDNHKQVAASMAKLLSFGLGAQEQFRSVGRAMSEFRSAAESAGVLVMRTKYGQGRYVRKLDANEFRGFALSDRYAPLVFINDTDYEPAQMFTLAHELAHIWLGDTGVSSVDAGDACKSRYSKKEAWCYRVAAEFLVPMEKLEDLDASSEDFLSYVAKKAKSLHVSKQVILHRLHDKGRLNRRTYETLVSKTADNATKTTKTAAAKGTKKARANGQARKPAKRQKKDKVATAVDKAFSLVGKKFARAVAYRALEQKTLLTDAFRMIGTWNYDALVKINRTMHSDGEESLYTRY